MAEPKRVLCITDLSGAGRAGMAVVLPVLAACGVQACVLPSMLFSTHHGGFKEVAESTTEPFASDCLSHFRREGITFDAIYIGYLTSKDEFSLAWRALRLYYNAFKIVDPVLGDNCKPYSRVDEDIVDMMRALCGQADLITPNYTESALLMNEMPMQSRLADKALRKRLEMLSNLGKNHGGSSSVLVTSCPSAENAGHEIAGFNKITGAAFKVPLMYVPQSYPGTGDLFSAAITGLVLNGASVEEAAQRASRFVEAGVRATYEGGGEVRHGVWFEGCLSMLMNPDAPKPLENLGYTNF